MINVNTPLNNALKWLCTISLPMMVIGSHLPALMYPEPVRMWVAAYDAYGEEGLRPRDKGVSIDPEIRIEAVNAVLSGKYPGVRRQPNTSLLVQPPSADG